MRRDELDDLVDELVSRDGSHPDQLWTQVLALGLAGIGIAESSGGSGGTLSDLATVVRAFARNGVSVPIIEAAIADFALAQAEAGAVADAARGAGQARAAEYATDMAGQHVNPVQVPVAGAREAETLVLFAADDNAFCVDLRRPEIAWSDTVELAGDAVSLLDLRNVERSPLGRIPGLRERFLVLASAATLGAAEGAFTLTRRYVTQREQFGAPLRSLPAVARSLALMRIQLIQGEAALDQAIAAASHAPGHNIACVLAARAVSSKAGSEIARLAHQLHGAMGVTREYPLHRFTRRIWAWRDKGGSEQVCLQELGEYALAGGEHVIWEHLTAVVTPPT